MDLELSPSEIAFRDELAAWLRDNLPDESRMSRLRGLPEERSYAIRREWDKKLGASGWLGVSWPKEFGGRGATAMEQAIYLEELLKADAPEPLDQLGLPLVGPTIIDIGTDEQKRAYLPPMMHADVLWCQGFSEPNAGSDLAGLQTRADRPSPKDDEWVVNGQKIWSSQAHYSRWCALLARTDQDAPKHKGISFFLVDMSTAGLSVRPIKQISGDADFCELFFDNVRVPHENLLGELNGGWAVANRLLAYERGVITMEMVLGYQRQWNEMKEYASSTSRPSSKDGSLIDDPRVRERLASCWTDIQLMRLANLRYITQYMRGSPPGAETSYMKLFWASTEQALSDLAMELAGPETLIMPGGEEGVHGGEWTRAYFMSRAASIYGGTYDIQRNIIAERVFGLPR